MTSLLTALVLGAASYSQSVTKDRGYIAAKFSTPYGGVTVYLPNDIAPGDRISGTVFTDTKDPMFDTITVSIGNVVGTQPKPDSKIRTFLVPTDAKSGIPLIVQGKDGSQLGAIRIGVTNAQEPLDAYTFPNFVQIGRLGVIYGPFNGSLSNTSFEINNKDVSVLAESPHSIVVYLPYDVTSGPVKAKVTEGFKVAETQIRAIGLDVTALKTDLKRGETTTVSLRVDGLSGLDETSIPFIQLQNLTPNILDLEGQEIHSVIPKVGPDGTYKKDFKAKSLKSGNFLLTTYIEPGQGIPVLPKIK